MMGTVFTKWLPWIIATIVSLGALYYTKQSADEARLAREDSKPALHVSLVTGAPYFTRDGEKIDIGMALSEFATSMLGSQLAPRLHSMSLITQQGANRIITNGRVQLERFANTAMSVPIAYRIANNGGTRTTILQARVVVRLAQVDIAESKELPLLTGEVIEQGRFLEGDAEIVVVGEFVELVGLNYLKYITPLILSGNDAMIENIGTFKKYVFPFYDDLNKKLFPSYSGDDPKIELKLVVEDQFGTTAIADSNIHVPGIRQLREAFED